MLIFVLIFALWTVVCVMKSLENERHWFQFILIDQLRGKYAKLCKEINVKDNLIKFDLRERSKKHLSLLFSIGSPHDIIIFKAYPTLLNWNSNLGSPCCGSVAISSRNRLFTFKALFTHNNGYIKEK